METEKETIAICPYHQQKQTPLIWTYAFPGAEWWCPACGANFGMFGEKQEEATPELLKLKEELKEKTQEFLSARGTFSCSSLKWKGERITPDKLPAEEIERRKKIITEYKYEL